MNIAVPPLRVLDPSVAVPSINVTVPVAFEGSVAVNVTVAPKVDGFEEDERLTIGVIRLTDCVKAADITVL